MPRKSPDELDLTPPNVVEATPRWMYWTMTMALMVVIMVLFGLYGCYDKGLDQEAAEGGDVIDNIIILSIAGFALANVFFWSGRWLWLRWMGHPLSMEPPLPDTSAPTQEQTPINRSAEKRRLRHARRKRR